MRRDKANEFLGVMILVFFETTRFSASFRSSCSKAEAIRSIWFFVVPWRAASSRPPRDGFADLLGYFAGLGGVQLKILRHGHRQSEGGGAVILINRRGQDTRLYVGRHGVEVLCRG